MKIIAVAFLCLLVAATAVEIKSTINPAPQKEVGVDLCPLCVSFMSQSISEILNIILNAGVIGSCGELCGLLPNQLEQLACNLLCDYVGVELFVKLVEKADLDPIYFCELLKTCPIHDCEGPCIQITRTAVSPPSGPAGSTFDLEMIFTVNNQTGTGEYGITIYPPDGMPFGGSELDEGFKPGEYGAKFQLKAEPTEDEPFSPGEYKVDMFICEGQCGSKHPHSYVYDVKKTSFQITE